MQQYHAIKQQHPDVLLLFQVGDFYELFFEDAKIAASILGIALTKRGYHNSEPIPLCGIPVHALDAYIGKLIKAGHKVALCDQLQQAVPGKLVERGITQILTPGTLTDLKLLDEKSASYLAAFFPMQESWGLLFAELLTGQLYATVLPASSERQLEAELLRFFPDEIIISDNEQSKTLATWFKKQGYYTTLQALDVHQCEAGHAMQQWLTEQFEPEQVKELVNRHAAHHAIGLLYNYLSKTQARALHQFHKIHWYEPEAFLMLDAATQRNLELVRNNQSHDAMHTLYSIMDCSITAMGSRRIKQWLCRPLRDATAITQRLDMVELLVAHTSLAHELGQLLRSMGDIERIIGRIALLRAHLYDYLHLMRCLAVVPNVKQLLERMAPIELAVLMHGQIKDFTELHMHLVRALNEDTQKEWLIKSGYDEQLDRMRSLVHNSNQQLLALEKQEQQATSINSLKIRYNLITGYYFEVTKAHLHAVPDRFIRLQTLVGKERFITPALRELQAEIQQAHAGINQREQELFEALKQMVVPHISELRRFAYTMSVLDALLSFSQVAYCNNYVRPSFNTQRDIVITQGRHPVVEQTLGSRFIPNDTLLTNDQSSWIITGPNMGGKSTYLRQVAHICILAQSGSFVPASAACLPLLDRIFTRIGSGDYLAGGKSTFLVEMEETAYICAQATEHSLAVFDEIGRGTSTFDGMAIAQAVIEHVHTAIRARCLFATHYHEITNLEKTVPGVVCYHTASKRTGQGILFLHKIVPGVAPSSFGIEVAKLAQLPVAVVSRATQLLAELQAQHTTVTHAPAAPVEKPIMVRYQQLMEHILAVDNNNLTPKQAFDLIWHLKEQLQQT